MQFFTDNVLVPGHAATAEFVGAVVESVCRLFPDSPWIHIGGDEVPDGAWSASPVVERFCADLGLTHSRAAHPQPQVPKPEMIHAMLDAARAFEEQDR